MSTSVALQEPFCFWSETYVMQPGNGRRRAISTQLQLLETATTAEEFWKMLEAHSARTANLSSLHIFKVGITPQYDDPKNANGGHFKTKPHSDEAAETAMQRLAEGFLTRSLACYGAVHGVTIAKKSKSSLVKLWVADSLNQAVLDALTGWLDENLAELCGRRLFSPHKYILNTFSQQRRQSEPNPATPPHQSLVTPQPSRSLYDPSAASGAAAWDSYRGYPVEFGWYSWPGSAPTAGWPEAFYGPYAMPLTSSDWQPSGSRPSGGEGGVLPDPPRAAGYGASLDSLMVCSRSDPGWGAATQAAMAPRLEATMRKCNSQRRSTGNGTGTGSFSHDATSVRSSFSQASVASEDDALG